LWLGLSIAHFEPDWHHAGFSALASLISMWVTYHDRYLRPRWSAPIDPPGRV
jgi:hypothetical protein